MFLCHPTRKLLVSINQSSYLIYFCYNFFDSAYETNIYEIKSRNYVADIDSFYFSSFIFKKNHGFIQKGNPLEKVVIVEKELDGIDIDDIGNLEDSSRLVFIDEECQNLIVVNDDGERTRNINQKGKSGTLH